MPKALLNRYTPEIPPGKLAKMTWQFPVCTLQYQRLTAQPAMDFATHYTEAKAVPDVILPKVNYLCISDLSYHGVQIYLENFRPVNARLEPIDEVDLTRIHEISVEYTSAEFDVVDCCITALAERSNTARVATFDCRVFPSSARNTVIIFNCCPEYPFIFHLEEVLRSMVAQYPSTSAGDASKPDKSEAIGDTEKPP